MKLFPLFPFFSTVFSFPSFPLSSLFAFNYRWGHFIFTVTEYFLPSFFSPPPHPSITTSHLTLCPREEELSHAIPSISLLFLLQIVSEESEKRGKKRARKGREKREERKQKWKAKKNEKKSMEKCSIRKERKGKREERGFGMK